VRRRERSFCVVVSFYSSTCRWCGGSLLDWTHFFRTPRSSPFRKPKSEQVTTRVTLPVPSTIIMATANGASAIPARPVARRQWLKDNDAEGATVPSLSPISSLSSSSAEHRPLKKRRMSPPPPLPVAAAAPKKKAAAAHVSDDEDYSEEEERQDQHKWRQEANNVVPSSSKGTSRRSKQHPLFVFEAGQSSTSTSQNGGSGDASLLMQPLSARPALPPPSSLAEPLLGPLSWDLSFGAKRATTGLIEHHNSSGSYFISCDGNNYSDYDDSAEGKRRRLVSYLTKRRRKITAAPPPKLPPQLPPRRHRPQRQRQPQRHPIGSAVVSPMLPPMTPYKAVMLPPRVAMPPAPATAMALPSWQVSSSFPPPPLPPRSGPTSVPATNLAPIVLAPPKVSSSEPADVLEAALALTSIFAPLPTSH